MRAGLEIGSTPCEAKFGISLDVSLQSGAERDSNRLAYWLCSLRQIRFLLITSIARCLFSG